jgi:hypothetical protein
VINVIICRERDRDGGVREKIFNFHLGHIILENGEKCTKLRWRVGLRAELIITYAMFRS